MTYYQTTLEAISMSTFHDIERHNSVADRADTNRIWRCGCESMTGDNIKTMLHLCDFHMGFEAGINLCLKVPCNPKGVS